MIRLHAVIKSTLLTLVVFSVLMSIRFSDLERHQDAVASQVESALLKTTTEVQRAIDEVLVLTDVLSSLVYIKPDFTESDFNRVTEIYGSKHPAVLSLQLAPNGVVTYVSNPEANRSAIGHDLLSGESSSTSARLARDTHTKISVGPVPLIQGGQAMITRDPIFSENGEFWGFATILIDLNTFVKQHVSEVELASIAIRSVSEDGKPGEVFIGNPDVFENDHVEYPVNFGDRRWIFGATDTLIPEVSNFIISSGFLALVALICVFVFASSYKLITSRTILEETVDLRTQSLQDALEELSSQNRKRNQLLGMVAHELRTPLSAIGMMCDQHNDQEWRNARQQVARNVRDIIYTLDDMRLLVNPNLVRPIRFEQFNITLFNEAIATSVASIVAATGMSYKQFDATPAAMNDLLLETDIYRTRVALTNVIRNACLHSQGSFVSMVSRVHLEQGGRLYLDWLIADDGVGIAGDNLERMFEPGERGDTSADGTGLGLYISKTWIEEIGGAVEYRLRKTGGSEFLVRIPLTFASSIEPKSSGDDSSADRANALLSKLNVLMVEDEAVLRMLGQKLLEKIVNTVEIAEDGQVALTRFNTSYDLVLTDYFMPNITGVELARELRNQGYKGVIIGVTAATMGDQKNEMLTAGVDYVISKPLTRKAFTEAIVGLAAQGRFDSCDEALHG